MLSKDKAIFCKPSFYIMFNTKDLLEQIQPLFYILFHEPVLQVMNATFVSELLGVNIAKRKEKF